MAWSAPRTWATSEVVTAAHMNQEVRDNLNAGFPDAITPNDWNPTLGGTSSDATVQSNVGLEYVIAGVQFCWVAWEIATPGSGTYTVTLPSEANSGLYASTTAGTGTRIGGWHSRDLSPAWMVEGSVLLRTSTTAHFNGSSLIGSVGGVLSPTNPRTLGEGDTVNFYAVYPVA